MSPCRQATSPLLAVAAAALASATLAQGMGLTVPKSVGQTLPTSAPASMLAQKPPVPPGRDPGGVAVALIGAGIDYALDEVAPRLARDGEGELIGWDFQDADRRPFDRSKASAPPEWGLDGTLIASCLIRAGAARLVPVRIDPGDPAALARALLFVAQTPARVAVLAMGSASPAHWEPFRQAAQRLRHVLILVPAGEGSEPAYLAALGLENVLLVRAGGARAEAAPASGAVVALVAAASAATKLLALEPALDGAALKRRLGEASAGAK